MAGLECCIGLEQVTHFVNVEMVSITLQTLQRVCKNQHERRSWQESNCEKEQVSGPPANFDPPHML